MGPGWDPASKKRDAVTTQMGLVWGRVGSGGPGLGEPASKKRDPVTTQKWDPEDPDGARLAKHGTR